MKRLLILAGAAVIGIGATLGALFGTRGSGSSSDGARAAIVAPAGPYRGSEPPPGIKAPDFGLRSYRGPLVRMRDLRGKVVRVCEKPLLKCRKRVGQASALAVFLRQADEGRRPVAIPPGEGKYDQAHQWPGHEGGIHRQGRRGVGRACKVTP